MAVTALSGIMACRSIFFMTTQAVSLLAMVEAHGCPIVAVMAVATLPSKGVVARNISLMAGLAVTVEGVVERHAAPVTGVVTVLAHTLIMGGRSVGLVATLAIA
jgi:hypothetical protein